MNSTASIRQPAVAGAFYPNDPAELQLMINKMLAAASTTGAVPKVIIAPHAGYVYSGPVAASVYKLLEAAHATIKRVVLLGPSHRVPVNGIAISSAGFYSTPLGRVALDQEAIHAIATLPGVEQLDMAHTHEHSLEVHIPFLQTVLDDFTLVPLVVGDADSDQVAKIMDTLWGGNETLIVVSSDLSHYHDYEEAKSMDKATSDAIVHLRSDDIGYDDACGRNPVCGLLELASQRGLEVKTVDLRNSGDTAGPRDRVVGYGAYAFYE